MMELPEKSIKIEKILGKVPSSVVKLGNSVIVLCLLSFLCAGLFFKIPIYKSCTATYLNQNLIKKQCNIIINTNVNQIEFFQQNKNVIFLIDSYSPKKLIPINCSIDSIVSNNKKDSISVYTTVYKKSSLNLLSRLKTVKVEFQIDEVSILQRSCLSF